MLCRWTPLSRSPSARHREGWPPPSVVGLGHALSYNTSLKQGRISRGIHELHKVSLGLSMPYYFTPCERPSNYALGYSQAVVVSVRG
jgi:hypothetical protein